MTGTRFLLALLAGVLVVGCGSASEEPSANEDSKKPDQNQVDAVKAEGGIPN